MLFFTIGLLLRAHAVRFDWIERSGASLVLAFALSGTVLIYFQIQELSGLWQLPPWVYNTVVLAVRLTAALFFWWLAGAILRTAVSPIVMKAGRFVFIVFCTHMILFKASGLVWRGEFGGYYGEWYRLYFIVQPLLAFAAGWAIYRTCEAVAPALMPVLLGKRLSRHRGATMDRSAVKI